MRKVELRSMEQHKYETIKKLVETNGNKKRAAIKLNCTERTVNRLIIKYKTEGKAGFVHGNRGRLPATTIPLEVKNRIVSLYINEYRDANFKHFSEIVEEEFNIKVSDKSINNWLREEHVLSPKAKRKTKKAMKKILNKKLDDTKSKKAQNAIKEEIETIDHKDAHPLRPRCKYMGEMVQMDASSYNWIQEEKWHLHIAVDDAKGDVVGAWFDYQETLNGYYNVLYQCLTNHGIPAMIYTDRRTVFEYKRKNNPQDNEDTYTQFAYACHTLGVEIKTTSVACAKGRVERMNQTLQSRLPVDLRRHNIKNIEEANEFLKHHLEEYNSKFALQLNSTLSVYEKQPDIETINRTLAVISTRSIHSGHYLRYDNKYYIPVAENGKRVYFPKGTECHVIEAFDKNTYVNIHDTLYAVDEIPAHEAKSKTFDDDYKEPKQRKRYIPPMDHPWRKDNIIAFQSKQKHRISD